MGLTVNDQLPSRLLAKHLGVILLSQIDFPDLSENDFLNLNGQSGWSGAAFECHDKPIILYNCHHSDARNESTIMHELSHIILGHKPSVDENLRHLGLLLRNYDEIHENEANWLGGCLQLPFDGLVTALLKGKSNDEIALQYGASTDMVKFRINKSGANRKVYHIKNRRR
ncbi:ImmA/IrrE family metallo-endopeptidase [Ekhidna sp.]